MKCPIVGEVRNLVVKVADVCDDPRSTPSKHTARQFGKRAVLPRGSVTLG